MVDLEDWSHPYLDEEMFTRNTVFWTGQIGLLIGWLVIESFVDFVTVAGLWMLSDMALYAYRNDKQLFRVRTPGNGGENQH